MFDRAILASRLVDARKGAGLSQVDLAARAGIAETKISMYERDCATPTIQSLLAICAALDVPGGKLLGGVDSPIEKHAFIANDPFLSEISTLLPVLSPRNRAIILEVLLDLHSNSICDHGRCA